MTHTRICIRCGGKHHGKYMKCDPCMVVVGGNHQHWVTPVQSQPESSWMDHVEDHIHEDDYLTDGRMSEP